jgi:hypothetical protein
VVGIHGDVDYMNGKSFADLCLEDYQRLTEVTVSKARS